MGKGLQVTGIPSYEKRVALRVYSRKLVYFLFKFNLAEPLSWHQRLCQIRHQPDADYITSTCVTDSETEWIHGIPFAERGPAGTWRSGWAPCWLEAVKAVCSCFMSHKRLVEFFHCSANGGGLTGGGLQVRVFLALCTSQCKQSTWGFTASTGLIAPTRVHVKPACKSCCVCNFVINMVWCGQT